MPVTYVVSSGPSGSRRQRAMRLLGMSLKSSAPPRQTGPSVNVSPPATRSIGASGATRSWRRASRTSSGAVGHSGANGFEVRPSGGGNFSIVRCPPPGFSGFPYCGLTGPLRQSVSARFPLTTPLRRRTIDGARGGRDETLDSERAGSLFVHRPGTRTGSTFLAASPAGSWTQLASIQAGTAGAARHAHRAVSRPCRGADLHGVHVSARGRPGRAIRESQSELEGQRPRRGAQEIQVGRERQGPRELPANSRADGRPAGLDAEPQRCLRLAAAGHARRRAARAGEDAASGARGVLVLLFQRSGLLSDGALVPGALDQSSAAPAVNAPTLAATRAEGTGND